MMLKKLFSRFSIKGKLIAIHLLSSSMVIILLSGSFFAFVTISFFMHEREKLSAVATILSSNASAPLAFNDRKAGADLLATLKANSSIQSAYILDENNSEFARYPDDSSGRSPQRDIASIKEDIVSDRLLDMDGNIETISDIILDGKKIGSILISKNSQELIASLTFLSAVSVAVMLAALLITYFLSNALQGLITRPIILLSKAMESVSTSKDYSIHVEKESEDETGQLTDGFNDMITQIKNRDRALKEEMAKRLMAAESLRQSEERYRSLFNNRHTVMMIIDPDTGTIVDANPAAAAFYGYRPEEFQQMPMSRINTLKPAEIRDEMAKAASMKRNHFLFNHRLANGETRPVEVFSGPISIGSRNLLYTIVHDITERVKAEEAVKQMNEELEARVASRTADLQTVVNELESFCSSVSHDLRAPARNLNGISRILMEDYGDRLDDEGCRLLGRIVVSSSKMGQLIDDLLNLSRVSRHRLEIVEVDLSQRTREALAELQAGDPDRHVEAIIADGLTVQGDTRLLEIVMDNLLANAWKYTSHTQDARIEFGSLPGEGHSIYYVKDNGAGFDMAYANKLFAPFQRLHTEEEFEGVGIGLATVERIIARHGGRIWGEGLPGQGATFYFTLGG